MNLSDKLKDGLKVVLGIKLSQRQMRNAKKMSVFDVADNPGVLAVTNSGYFRRYDKIALKEKHVVDGTPLIRTVDKNYTPDGLLYYVETIEETNGAKWKVSETDYFPAGSFRGVSRWRD